MQKESLTSLEDRIRPGVAIGMPSSGGRTSQGLLPLLWGHTQGIWLTKILVRELLLIARNETKNYLVGSNLLAF